MEVHGSFAELIEQHNLEHIYKSASKMKQVMGFASLPEGFKIICNDMPEASLFSAGH